MYSKELINSVKEMRKISKKLREISCAKEIPISSVQWILRDCNMKHIIQLVITITFLTT